MSYEYQNVIVPLDYANKYPFFPEIVFEVCEFSNKLEHELGK